MLYLLPIQANSETIALLSGVGLVLLTLWSLPKLFWGLNVQWLDRDRRLAILALGGFVGSAVLVFLSITYLLGADLTGAFRYNFVYFPGVIGLIAAALGAGWQGARQIAQSPADRVPIALLKLMRVSGRKTILLIGLLSLLGGLTVVFNGGYQKVHRPDVVAQEIFAQSSQRILIAIPHRTHGQTGRLMGIALEFDRILASIRDRGSDFPLVDLQFLLANAQRSSEPIDKTLNTALSQVIQPMQSNSPSGAIDLWLINFHEVDQEPVERVLRQNRCAAQTDSESVDGYRYRMYRCRGRVRRN